MIFEILLCFLGKRGRPSNKKQLAIEYRPLNESVIVDQPRDENEHLLANFVATLIESHETEKVTIKHVNKSPNNNNNRLWLQSI